MCPTTINMHVIINSVSTVEYPLYLCEWLQLTTTTRILLHLKENKMFVAAIGKVRIKYTNYTMFFMQNTYVQLHERYPCILLQCYFLPHSSLMFKHQIVHLPPHVT